MRVHFLSTNIEMGCKVYLGFTKVIAWVQFSLGEEKPGATPNNALLV